MDLLGGFSSAASISLLLGPIFVLSRANQWSVIKSLGVLLGLFLIPVLLLTLIYQLELAPFYGRLVLSTIPIAIMIVLFALAKSVANRVKREG
ncbi:MAG: hypothetical protein WA790_05050 [Sulfitobacter sp.]